MIKYKFLLTILQKLSKLVGMIPFMFMCGFSVYELAMFECEAICSEMIHWKIN